MSYLQVKINNNTLTLRPNVILHNALFQGEYQCKDDKLVANDGQLIDTLCVERAENGFIIRRSIENISSKTVLLKELDVLVEGMTFGGNAKEDYYYCVEHPRLFGQYTLPVDFNREGKENEFGLNIQSIYADPGAINNRILQGPYMPYPAMLVSNYKTTDGVVFGTLAQDYFYHNYTLSHENDALLCHVYSSFKSIAYRELKAGEVLCDVWYVGETKNADDIGKIFDGYNQELRKVLENNVAKSDFNRHSLLWDSWNDGIFRDISEEMLLAEAKALQENIPTLEWIQMDDGYSSYCEEDVDLDSHGLGVPYEGVNGIDYVKFPNGLKGYTDKIRDLGLRPSIWIGGFCPVKSQIYREKPEWFIDFTYRCDFSQPLDVSQEEVREYMSYAIKNLTVDSGMEAVKHDFWSYAFEDSKPILSNNEKSGYEYRRWWGQEIRKNLPNGYVLIACDLNMGNPFLGQYFNSYRFGLDVQAGEWPRFCTSIFWGTTVLSTHTGDLFIPDCDSVGFLPKVSDDEFLLWTNFALISRTMVEISGRFTKIDTTSPRLKVLKKATACINNGQDVYFADFDYRKAGQVLPEKMYINMPFFSHDENNAYLPQKTVALFNYEETEKELVLDLEKIGLTGKTYAITNVWDETTSFGKEYRILLKPHASCLLSINALQDFAIVDANVALEKVQKVGNALTMQVKDCKDVSLGVLGDVKAVYLNDKKIDYVSQGNRIKIDCLQGGTLKIEF